MVIPTPTIGWRSRARIDQRGYLVSSDGKPFECATALMIILIRPRETNARRYV